MNAIPEKYADRPNLWRVACELSTYRNPRGVINALAAVPPSRKEEGAA